MADGTLDSELFVLFDHWPGRVINDPSKPLVTDAIVATAQHNTTAAVNTPGDKIQIYNNPAVGVGGRAGWATFVYLKGKAVTEANPTCAAKQVVVPNNASVWYQVTNDPDQCLDVTGSAFAAVLLSVMSFADTTTAYYGYFWCGGVCPEAYVSDLGGNYATTNDVIVGPIVISDLASADAIGLSAVGADTEVIIGFASEADA